MTITIGFAAIIFIVTIAVSLLGFKFPAIIDRAIFRPYYLHRRGQWERLITSGFVHADFWHLAFNMFTFYAFGFALERIIGSFKFAVLYFLGLVLSDVGTWYKHKNNPQYASLGASGAILAVLFAAILYMPEGSIFLFPIPVPIPVPIFAVLYLAYTIWQSRQDQGRINHDAHLGGAITGLAFVAVTDPSEYGEFFARVGNMLS